MSETETKLFSLGPNYIEKYRTDQGNPKVDVWSKNNVRLPVKRCAKKSFFTAKRLHLLALNAVNFCKICGFQLCIHRISYKKENAVNGYDPLTSYMSKLFYSTVPSVTYFNNISCEFNKSLEFNAEYF